MPTPLETVVDQRHVVVIGYGSPIRGDDAVGAMAADQLIDPLSSEQVTVHSRHILTAELVEEVRQASLVIFLDADAESPPGQVRCRKLRPDPGPKVVVAHDLDPRELLAWSRQLYQHVPDAYLVSVRAVEVGFGEYALSPSVRAAFEPMKRKVVELIDAHLALPK